MLPTPAPERESAPLADYGLALALFCLATWVRLVLFSPDARITYGTYYPAVLATLYFCGIGPGLLVTVLAAGVGVVWLTPPYGVFALDGPGAMALGLFVLTSLGGALGVRQLRAVTAQRELAHASAQASERRFRDLYDHAPCAYYSLDHEGRFVEANAVLLGWLGLREDELVGRRPAEFLTPDSAQRCLASHPTLMAQGQVGPLELDLLPRPGAPQRVSVSATALRDDEGRFLRSRSVMHDITELHSARLAWQRLSAQQAQMLNNDLVAMLRVKDRQIVWCNRAAERLYAHAPGTLLGRPTRLLYPSDEAYAQFADTIAQAQRGGQPYRGEVQLLRGDGRLVWVDVTGAPLDADGSEMLWMSIDVTPQHQRRHALEHIALHDPLTDLPNRALLQDRLHQAIAQAERQGHRLALAFIDLDGFKPINDRHGHAAGDVLLQQVSQRLQHAVRASDTVARVGGDEFVVLLAPLPDREEAEAVVARLRQAVEAPVTLAQGDTVRVGASLGLAHWPEDGADDARLLAAADRLMYEEKGRRRAARTAPG
jgi:diguanylate cyclase (GGDEF)-like protein/PAS domain S-box-containing protein